MWRGKSLCSTALTALLLALGAAAPPAVAAEPLHLLIPAGPGGGLDSTARALGRALQSAELRAPVSFENMTGGGGGRALSHFVETAARQQQALLINSTPLIVRSLQGLFPQSYRDLIPVAGLVAEYSAIAVRADSPLADWSALLAALRENPNALSIGGGSVRGSMDHIAFALAASAARLDPKALRYLPYDGGGRAMLALLGGEIAVLSTGLGETLGYLESGDLRLLAVLAPARVPEATGVPTLVELGVPVVFANWRGVFAAPGTSDAQVAALQRDVEKALETEVWRAELARYGWTPMAFFGPAFLDFLEQQESELRSVLTDLGFIAARP